MVYLLSSDYSSQVRVSVGLEHPDDLWDDLRAALRVLEPSSKL